jgi:hypothetical protein
MTQALQASGYSGPERRRHRVFVTQNHEYHCRDGVCVAVRDITTGEFLPGHTAIGKRASAAVKLCEDGIESISMPDDAHIGERLHFTSGVDDRHDVLTSALCSIERPPKEIVARYAIC